jgi:hypothetical protein
VGVARTAAAPNALSSCLTSPLTWGAAEAVGIRNGVPGQTTLVFNEFVLRYDSVAGAHRAVADAWRQFADCPRTTAVSTDPFTAPGPSIPYNLDEWFANQRATFASAQTRGQPTPMYALRVARLANIVLVIDDVGAPDDRAELLRTREGQAPPAAPAFVLHRPDAGPGSYVGGPV